MVPDSREVAAAAAAAVGPLRQTRQELWYQQQYHQMGFHTVNINWTGKLQQPWYRDSTGKPSYLTSVAAAATLHQYAWVEPLKVKSFTTQNTLHSYNAKHHTLNNKCYTNSPI